MFQMPSDSAAEAGASASDSSSSSDEYNLGVKANLKPEACLDFALDATRFVYPLHACVLWNLMFMVSPSIPEPELNPPQQFSPSKRTTSVRITSTPSHSTPSYYFLLLNTCPSTLTHMCLLRFCQDPACEYTRDDVKEHDAEMQDKLADSPFIQVDSAPPSSFGRGNFIPHGCPVLSGVRGSKAIDDSELWGSSYQASGPVSITNNDADLSLVPPIRFCHLAKTSSRHRLTFFCAEPWFLRV